MGAHNYRLLWPPPPSKRSFARRILCAHLLDNKHAHKRARDKNRRHDDYNQMPACVSVCVCIESNSDRAASGFRNRFFLSSMSVLVYMLEKENGTRNYGGVVKLTI